MHATLAQFTRTFSVRLRGIPISIYDDMRGAVNDKLCLRGVQMRKKAVLRLIEVSIEPS